MTATGLDLGAVSNLSREFVGDTETLPVPGTKGCSAADKLRVIQLTRQDSQRVERLSKRGALQARTHS